jgi:hypothetical protein
MNAEKNLSPKKCSGTLSNPQIKKMVKKHKKTPELYYMSIK